MTQVPLLEPAVWLCRASDLLYLLKRARPEWKLEVLQLHTGRTFTLKEDAWCYQEGVLGRVALGSLIGRRKALYTP